MRKHEPRTVHVTVPAKLMAGLREVAQRRSQIENHAVTVSEVADDALEYGLAKVEWDLKFQSVHFDGKTETIKTGKEARKAFAELRKGRPRLTPNQRERVMAETFENSAIRRYIVAKRLQAALQADDISRIKYWAQRVVDDEDPPESHFASPEAARDHKKYMQLAVRKFKKRFAHLEPKGDGLAAKGPEDD